MNDILSSLQQTLNPDPNIRIAAELRLAELFVQPREHFDCMEIYLFDAFFRDWSCISTNTVIKRN
jgi:hypothetical protein